MSKDLIFNKKPKTKQVKTVELWENQLPLSIPFFLMKERRRLLPLIDLTRYDLVMPSDVLQPRDEYYHEITGTWCPANAIGRVAGTINIYRRNRK